MLPQELQDILNESTIMVLETEDGKKIINPTKQRVIDELYSLDEFENSFMILDKKNEDGVEGYIQTAIGSKKFIVEQRIYSSDGTATQWKADYHDNLVPEKDESECKIKCKPVETLDIETVQYLFEAFMKGELLPKNVKWIDITDDLR